MAVLGYGLWQRRFGGDPAVLGRQVTFNRYSFTIVGVAPKGFAGLPAGYGAPRPAKRRPFSVIAGAISILTGLSIAAALKRVTGTWWR